jgi:hypothetical protein
MKANPPLGGTNKNIHNPNCLDPFNFTTYYSFQKDFSFWILNQKTTQVVLNLKLQLNFLKFSFNIPNEWLRKGF